jgi:hypothetical protein
MGNLNSVYNLLKHSVKNFDEFINNFSIEYDKSCEDTIDSLETAFCNAYKSIDNPLLLKDLEDFRLQKYIQLQTIKNEINSKEKYLSDYTEGGHFKIDKNYVAQLENQIKATNKVKNAIQYSLSLLDKVIEKVREEVAFTEPVKNELLEKEDMVR